MVSRWLGIRPPSKTRILISIGNTTIDHKIMKAETETIVTKQIKVKEETYEELTDLGKKNETYDEIIWKLIQEHNSSKVVKK